MHPDIYSSISNNSQIRERAQIFIDWWMDKEHVIYTRSGILLGDEKEWTIALCDNMDGTRVYYVKWNKLEKYKYHMISLICGV